MPEHTQVTTATVLADGLVTRYTRRGTGPSVLLLGPGPHDPFAAALARSFRVFVPEVPRGPPACWLRGLLDGLGLGAVAVIAYPALAGAAAACARQDPERVRGVVIVTPDGTSPPDWAALSGAVSRLLE